MIYYYQNMIRRTIGLTVDIFTKHLPSSHFLALQAKLSIVPRLVSLQGMITLTTNSRIKLTCTLEFCYKSNHVPKSCFLVRLVTKWCRLTENTSFILKLKLLHLFERRNKSKISYINNS